MTPLPTISIVVPSLDQGRFLGEALQSLVDQEYPALEVIVQDGGSSDDSVAIARGPGERLLITKGAPESVLSVCTSFDGGTVESCHAVHESLARQGKRVLGVASKSLPVADAYTAADEHSLTFAGFLGAAAIEPPTGLVGAAIALVAIFLPSALLVVGGLPFWAALRRFALAQRALMGINAGVVGLLGAALYDPVVTEGIRSPMALVIAVVAFVALAVWRLPPWAVVVAAGVIGLVVL